MAQNLGSHALPGFYHDTDGAAAHNTREGMPCGMDPQTESAAMIEECLPLIRALGVGRHAIAIGGSRGKGVADRRSDYDFRLYCDEIRGGVDYEQTPAWVEFAEAVERWRAQGLVIDHVWMRTFAEIDAALQPWLGGLIQPVDLLWTLWGYHLLPDLYHQQIIEDPFGLAAAWKARLRVYPPTLKQALVTKHLGSLRYWRSDYHYANKVARGDAVFLAGMAARLVHDLMQVLFALNETYYVGDGNNLDFAGEFALLPPDFPQRVELALYPPATEDRFVQQRLTLVGLIGDVERLAADVPS